MPRRPKAPAPENHERWLVSYADFITLLFAFFVVMFASTQTDHKRAQQISDSVKKALAEDHMRAVVAAVLGGTVNDKGKGNAMMRGPGGANKGDKDPAAKPPPPESAPPPDNGAPPPIQVAELLPTMSFLTKDLTSELKAGVMQIHMERRGLVITFNQTAHFASGGNDLTPAAYKSMEKIARVLSQIPNPIRLEGHTDSIPINNSRFRSNWELSAARSIAMLEVLSNRFGISKDRMSIGGYADAAPIDTNDTAEGRSHNRRVDLVILNEAGMAAEPSAPETPAPAAAAHKKRSPTEPGR